MLFSVYPDSLTPDMHIGYRRLLGRLLLRTWLWRAWVRLHSCTCRTRAA